MELWKSPGCSVVQPPLCLIWAGDVGSLYWILCFLYLLPMSWGADLTSIWSFFFLDDLTFGVDSSRFLLVDCGKTNKDEFPVTLQWRGISRGSTQFGEESKCEVQTWYLGCLNLRRRVKNYQSYLCWAAAFTSKMSFDTTLIAWMCWSWAICVHARPCTSLRKQNIDNWAMMHANIFPNIR